MTELGAAGWSYQSILFILTLRHLNRLRNCLAIGRVLNTLPLPYKNANDRPNYSTHVRNESAYALKWSRLHVHLTSLFLYNP